MATLTTKLEIKSWDEKPAQVLGGERTIARATVALAADEDALAVEGVLESVLFYPDKEHSTYSGFLFLSGRLGSRSGSVVLAATGDYADGTATMDLRVVSGTDELAGIRGTGRSVSTHGDYPFMPLELDYEVG